MSEEPQGFIPPHGGYQEWDKNSKEALFVRNLAIGKLAWNADGTQVTQATHEPQDRSPASHMSPITYDTFRPFENLMIFFAI